MDVAEPQERRGRRGRAERAAAQKAAVVKAPQPRLPFPPVSVVSDDQLEAIHAASLTILAEIGMDFLHQEAKAILKQAGARVEDGSDRVRFDKALVESVVGLAPKSFTLHARNRESSVVLGGNAVAFCSVASAPNAA
ncbi:MAG: trimethylamine methyltransferase family protein, partial [Hyphomicrobiales bacterium]|nr:trimethylamine methyltransferase family protein [Hyphomicrobiales bacterium]